MPTQRLLLLIAVCLLSGLTHPALAIEIPGALSDKLARGEAADVIIEFVDDSIETKAKARARNSKGYETAATLKFRADNYKLIKQNTNTALTKFSSQHVQDYSHLPLQTRRFDSLQALRSWANHPQIKAIYEDRLVHHTLSNSLPLIEQPQVAAAGYTGQGSTVVVIDNGISIGNSAFGGCTAPGVPASCKVIVNQLAGTATGGTANHGTHVSATVLGIAPDTRIAMQNVFSGENASSSNILTAINWAISNASLYNIAAINMSLGDGSQYSSPCSSGNPFITPINNAMNAGISVVAASGNDGHTNGLNWPACTPSVISVGAVYSKDFGSVSGSCTDSSSYTDKVTCFSNSASYLTMLAPGAFVTAAGMTMSGTSMASPHIAGAIAVLRAAFPTDTLSATRNRLVTGGISVADSRNGIITPRLNLQNAARPKNDAYASRIALNGSSGSSTGSNLLASTESGEILISPQASGRSVWWKWTAPASGQVSLDTHGSNFNTQLAVHNSASSPASLSTLASNDDDGSSNGNSGVFFQASSGSTYVFRIDGTNAAQGAIALNWSLNTSAIANLAATISGNSSGSSGSNSNYTFTLSNSGPQTATHAILQITLPANASLQSLPASCTQNGLTLSCNLGQLSVNSSATLVLTLTWLDDNSRTLSANAGSDLSDNSPGDNSTSLTISPPTGNSEADIPTLPEWAALILGTLLMLSLQKTSRAEPL